MKCNLCNKNFGRQGGSFNKHLLREHKIQDFKSYVVLTEFDNIHPLCRCGCGEETTYFNNEFKKFKHGHNSILESDLLKKTRPIDEIVNLYESGNTGDDISRLLNLDRSIIFKIISEFSKTRDKSNCRIKYEIDDTVFEDINTEEKAYWLGFLYADGYINYKKNSVTLALSNQDLDVLQNYKLFLKTTKEIRKNNENSSKVVIENKKIANDLRSKGLIQAKTHKLTFPKIDKKLINHFIRGYFDGDGCITYGKNIKNPASISITSTMSFLKEIDTEININFSYVKRHKDRDDEIFTITSGGIGNLIKFYVFLYNDSTISMQRKKIKFENWFKNYFNNFKISNKTLELKKMLKI